MRKIVYVFSLGLSILLSLFITTNYFAYSIHYAHIIGHPQFGRFYEPFHILFWYLTLGIEPGYYHAPFALLAFSLLLFCGGASYLYVKTKSNIIGIYGKSRWLAERELKATGMFTSGGVILGQNAKASFRQRGDGSWKYIRAGKIIFNDEKEHILVVAPTRRGKGISVVIPTLISATRYSVVVYDIKKEAYTLTAGWRRRFSHVLCFEPANPESSIHFNPLEEIELGPLEISQTQNLVALLANPTGDANPDHWTKTASDLLTGCILHVLYSEKEKSLAGVYTFLNSPDRTIIDTLNFMLETQHLNGHTHPAVAETARNMLNKAPNELSSVVSTASSYLSVYRDPIVANNTSNSDFRIKDLTNLDHPCSLYICVSPNDAYRLRPLTRLLLQLIGTTLTSRLDINKHRLLYLIDEFPELGKMDFFESQLAFMAGYGIKVIAIAQSFSQLFAKYGERTSIIDNCRYKAVLGVGAPSDAKLVGDFLGSFSMIKKTHSTSGTIGTFIAANRSTSTTESAQQLMTQDEILHLPYEDWILIADGIFPYRGKKIMSYIDPRFISKMNLPVPQTRIQQLIEFPVPIRPVQVQPLAITARLATLRIEAPAPESARTSPSEAPAMTAPANPLGSARFAALPTATAPNDDFDDTEQESDSITDLIVP